MTTNVSSSPAAAAPSREPAAASAASRMRDLHPGWFAAVTASTSPAAVHPVTLVCGSPQ